MDSFLETPAPGGEILTFQFPPKSNCLIQLASQFCCMVVNHGSSPRLRKTRSMNFVLHRIMLNIKRIDRVTNVSIYNLTNFISFRIIWQFTKLQYNIQRLKYSTCTKVKTHYRKRNGTMPRRAQESPKKGLFPLGSF